VKQYIIHHNDFLSPFVLAQNKEEQQGKTAGTAAAGAFSCDTEIKHIKTDICIHSTVI